MEKVKHKKEKSANIETGIPSAPTMEDFYYDPGIRDHETVSDPLGVANFTNPENPICDNLHDLAITESTAPVLEEPSSAPPLDLDSESASPATAPPIYFDLSAQLSYMSPHHHAASQLRTLQPQEAEGEGEVEVEAAEDTETAPEPEAEIVPFTDSQLHALYHNVELEKNAEFVDHWLDTQTHVERFPLDEMLLSYLRVRTVLCTSRRRYDADREQVASLETELWVLGAETVEEEGECDDGNTVTASKDAVVADYSDTAAAGLKSRLKKCKETLTEDYSLHSFRAELIKIQIDDFLHSVISRHQGGLLDTSLGAQVYTSHEEVRLAVSVLFKFLRKDIADEVMVADLKTWLGKMVALVLGEATLYDHLFIMNHIMRCPAGVGSWAAAFIQPPVPVTDLEETSFDNPFLNQLITILATILLPVKDRRRFVAEFRLRHRWEPGAGEGAGAEQDRVWTVLDGEGSEDEDPEECWAQLRETDLVQLLAQVPVSHMFRYVLRVETRDGADVYDVRHSSQLSVLKLFAFSTQFVYLLREGLKTFNTPKYRQFAKRLGRLIRHTVHFVSDHWQNFKQEQVLASTDSSMLLRLQVEYDNFFLRAAKCIFSSQKLGTWQYLADIPFATISANMLWRIFYVLHLDYREEHHSDFGVEITDWAEVLANPDLQLQFEEKCYEAGEFEVYFLLSSFANMAISRGLEDKLFIERATLDLFDVGFVCETTRNSCSKNCRDLLSTVCSKHPFLLTSLLGVMSNRIQHIGDLCGYLVQSLPWDCWRPELGELELVFSWLRLPPLSLESQLARTVLGHMDWSHGSLAPELHTRAALAVVQAVIRLSSDSAPATISGGGGSVAAVTHLALASFSAGPLGSLVSWAWQLVSRLHLHLMDRSGAESAALVAGDQDLLSRLLDYDLSPDMEEVVAAAVGKNPLACHLCLCLTQVGHSLPELLERGFGLLKTIQEAGRYSSVVEILLNVVPLFLCDESSIQNEAFLSTLAALLSADQTYLSMAKSIISGEFPGPVTRELGHMVEKMIVSFQRYGLQSPRSIVSLWIKIVTKVPDWSLNSSALYLLDILCSHSFLDPVVHADTLLFAKNVHKENINNESGTGFISWITGINYSGYKLVFATSSPQFPYLAYFMLQAEDAHVRNTGLWSEMVAQLADSKALEEALAAAASTCRASPPLSAQLPVYRWVAQALDTPPAHPLQPVFWQRFFQCFLSRPAPRAGGEEPRGVGMSFFSGMINSMYLKKVKNFLKGLHDYHEKFGNSEKPLCGKLCRLYKSFYLWLDESKILDSTLYLPALAPVYEPAKLAQLLAGDGALWLECVDTEAVLDTQTSAVQQWDKNHFRQIATTVKKRSINHESDLTPTERIIKRLGSYEPRVSPPVLGLAAAPIPQVPMSTLVCEEALLQFLETPLSVLNDMSAGFSTNTSAYGSLNCSYMELSPLLWRDEEVETIVRKACPGTKRGKEKIDCCGPAKILLKYSEARKQDDIRVKLENNRKEWETVETRLLSPPSVAFVTAASSLNSACNKILRLYEKDLGRGQGSAASPHHGLALAVFYLVTSRITEDWLVCPSLRHFISDTLELLASVVVSCSPGQAPRLLRVLLQSPHLSPFLSAHFCPNIEDSDEVIQIYRTISELPEGDGALPFVLLSKLDLATWLLRSSSQQQRSQILLLISAALARTGPEPAQAREMLHGLQRKHLFQVFCHFNQQHYLEILKILLSLSEKNQLDPRVWVDLLNAVTQSPGKFSLEHQTREERLEAVTAFVSAETDINLQQTANMVAELQHHFHTERLHFGLYGLYPKYRPYVEALAAYFSVLGLKIVLGQTKLDQGALRPDHLDTLWATIEALFAPWLFPLSASERQSAATWIQQLTNESALLPPWIPGDCALASAVLAAWAACVRAMADHDPARGSGVLSRVWAQYASHWALPGVKEHVFGVIHPVLASLDWSKLSPSHQDLELMVRVMGQFLPACHAFLGTVFVQIRWAELVTAEVSTAQPANLHPALLCLLVKLGGEPSVRQSGRLVAVLQQAEAWDWGRVDSAKYEALAQWLVMSIDCRAIVKHPERSPLDEATLKLFKAAAISGPESVKKQKIWIKCCTRLLSSCGSKHKNFLSYNQPALHTAVRRLLEDMTALGSQDPASSPAVVKDFLTLLNSNSSSCLPGAAVMVLQSWLGGLHRASPPLHALLAQAAVCINEVRVAAAVLEAVLESWFRDTEDDNSDNSWGAVLGLLAWPAGTRMTQVLEQSVQAGHILLLHAYLSYRRPQAASIKEEQMLASSVLEWLRSLSLAPGLGAGAEAKLPLLYRQLVTLLQRQNQLGPEPAWTVAALLQLCDVLAAIADTSPGWGQNLLGAIGLGSSNTVSHKGKFLARSLLVYLRMLVNSKRTSLMEKLLDEDSADSRKKLISSPEVKPHVEKLSSFKSNKAFSGIHDLIDWVLYQIKDESNTLADAHLFIDHIVIDKLYVELYLQT